MALDISHLRGIQGTEGFLKAGTTDATKPNVFGNGAFGKLAAWIRNPGSDANKALKNDFLAQLGTTYGPQFRAAHEDEVGKTGKPLSLRVVKDIIKSGDQHLADQAKAKEQRLGQTRALAGEMVSLDRTSGAPLATELDALIDKSGLGDRLKLMTSNSALDKDPSTGSMQYKNEHVKLPDSMVKEIREKIVPASNDGTVPVSRNQALEIAKDVLGKSGLIDRKLSHLDALDKRADLTAGQRAGARDAIVRNDYATFADFEKAYFRGTAPSEMNTKVYGGTVKDQKDHKNASLETVGANLKNKAYDASTYDPSAYFKGVDVGAGKNNQAFSVNRSILGHFASKIDDPSGKTKDALNQRSMAYMARFATSLQDKGIGMGQAPWQGKNDQYFRGGASGLTTNYTTTMARTLGVHPDTVTLVTDKRVMDVVKRDFAMTSTDNFMQWDDAEFNSLIDAARAGKGDVLLDLTGFIAGTAHGHSGDLEGLKTALEVAETFVYDAMKTAVDNYVADFKKNNPDKDAPDAQKLFQTVRSHVVMGSTLQVGDQSLLHITRLNAPSERGTQPDQGELNLTKQVRAIVNHNGYTVGPNQLIESWLKSAPNSETALGGIEALMAGRSVAPESVVFSGDVSKLATFKTMTEFNLTTIVNDFKGLGTAPSPKPYQKVSVDTTLALVSGLADAGIHQKMDALGLGDMLQLSLNRIQGAMQDAVALKDDFRGFNAQIEIIHNEIATLNVLCWPIRPEDFNQMMNDTTKLLPDVFKGTDVKVNFEIKNSGMRSLNAALSGVEQIKKGLGGSGPLNIGVQANCYYESSGYVLSDGNTNRSFTLDGQALTSSVDTIEKNLVKVGPDTQGKPHKLDVFVAEFHHNISAMLDSYQAESVTDQVDKLFEKGLVSDKFTVAIDSTIARTDSQEFKDFLAHNKDRIDSGKLNVVFYRSGQKFDMMGMDNFNGGIMATVNNGDKGGWGEFSKASGGDKGSNYNLQGLGALQKYAQTELNDYRTALMTATRKLNSPKSSTNPTGMPPEMFEQGPNRGATYLQLAVNTDPNAVFLDIRAPWLNGNPTMGEALAVALTDYLVNDMQGGHVGDRPSFGFVHSNVSTIVGSKFRFNPGLEDDATLGKYRDALVDMSNLLGIAMNDYKDPATFNAINANLLDPMKKSTRDTVMRLAIQGSPKSVEDSLALAKAFADIGNEKAAKRILDGLPNLNRTQVALLDGVQASLDKIKTPTTAELNTKLDATTSSARFAMEKGNVDKIELLTHLRGAESAIEGLGESVEGTLVSKLSADLKSSSIAGLDNFIKVAASIIADINDPNDPLSKALKTVSTLAGQDREIATRGSAPTDAKRSIENGIAVLDIRTRPKGTGQPWPQHALGDLTTTVQYEITDVGKRKPPTGGDRLIGSGTPAMDKLAKAMLGFGFTELDKIAVLEKDERIWSASQTYLQNLPTSQRPTRDFNGLADMMRMIDQGPRRGMYVGFEGMMQKAYERNDKGFVSASREVENAININATNIGVVGRMFSDPGFLNTVPPEHRQDLKALGEHYVALSAELSSPGGAGQTIVNFVRAVRTDPDGAMVQLVPDGKPGVKH